jgi:hypothetical protein
MLSVNNYEKLVKEQREVDNIFRNHDLQIEKIRDLAFSASKSMENLDSMLQQHTASVCSECRSVCCINRHSYHSFEDIVYIYALNKKMPAHTAGIQDSMPCQFLGKKGCCLPRLLRPYRCNWYFCSPLLERIEERPSRYYRLFITTLQDITTTRQRLIQEFEFLSHVNGKEFRA